MDWGAGGSGIGMRAVGKSNFGLENLSFAPGQTDPTQFQYNIPLTQGQFPRYSSATMHEFKISKK